MIMRESVNQRFRWTEILEKLDTIWGDTRKTEQRNLLELYKKKYSFPKRSIDIWNGLKNEVIMEKNAHQL